MDKIKKEDFEKWVKKHDWFKINEVSTPNGQQNHYLTPAGEFVICQYNLTGELAQIIKPIAAPLQGKPLGHFPLDLRGGGQFPGISG